MVHGSGYTGSCVQGTAGGSEGWADYAVRNGVPTFVVDQSGRARSGFDKTVLHEAEHKIDIGDLAGAKALIPTIGGSWGSNAWTNWFGHIVGPDTNDVTTGQMIRHGAPGDPLCATEPAHCSQLGRIPMEPEAPWAVDQAIKSRTGNGAPAGLGTITPDNAQVAANAAYLALDAYKFDVPNMETTLPGSLAANGQSVSGLNTWTPRALAELVEGLGGAVVATHSQSGAIGHHMARVLKEHGTLGLLKGLITIEGSCALTGGGLSLTPADFANIPYLAFKGDYTGTSAQCQTTVDAINAAGGKAEYVQLDQPGWWQGSYAGPYGPDYVGPFAGVSHMMMIESNPSPLGGASNLRVMDVLLGWADKNISKPTTTGCDEKGTPPGLSNKPGGLPPGQEKKI